MQVCQFAILTDKFDIDNMCRGGNWIKLRIVMREAVCGTGQPTL